jgi:hypothetical protein
MIADMGSHIDTDTTLFQNSFEGSGRSRLESAKLSQVDLEPFLRVELHRNVMDDT